MIFSDINLTMRAFVLAVVFSLALAFSTGQSGVTNDHHIQKSTLPMKWSTALYNLLKVWEMRAVQEQHGTLGLLVFRMTTAPQALFCLYVIDFIQTIIIRASLQCVPESLHWMHEWWGLSWLRWGKFDLIAVEKILDHGKFDQLQMNRTQDISPYILHFLISIESLFSFSNTVGFALISTKCEFVIGQYFLFTHKS